MARDTKLSEDLAALAAAERQQLGQAPGIEQLKALRDGGLPREEADRIRDRLAVDPELAAVFLELQRGSESPVPDGPAGEISDADVDDAWRQLAPRLGQDAPRIADAAYDTGEVVTFPRRGLYGILGLAASVILVVGLIWLFASRDRPALPDGKYYEVGITGIELRDSTLPVPGDAVGISFQIDTAALEAPGRFVVEVLDASGKVVRKERLNFEAGRRIVFGVPLSTLEAGRTYRLIVRAADASAADSPPIDVVFTPEFEPRPRTAGHPSAADPCQSLKEQLAVAKELRKAGERQAAEDAYHRALKEVRTQNCQYQEALLWNGLSTLAILEGRLVDSLRLLDRAGDVLATAGPVAPERAAAFAAKVTNLKATIEFNRAATYARLGWLDEAEKGLQKARSLYRLIGAGPIRHGKLLLQLARVYRLQNEIPEARSAVKDAFELATEDHKLTASLWQESAWLDFEEDRLDAAEHALDEALEALEQADDYAKANVFIDVAELSARQGRWAESLRWTEETLDLIEDADPPDLHLESYARHVRSVVLYKLGDPGGAITVADRGLALLEALRDVWRDQGLQFFALRQKHYRHRLDLAIAARDAKDAWGVFESSRAQTLLDNASERARRSASALAREESGEIVQARRDLLGAVRQLDKLPRDTEPSVREYHEKRFSDLRLSLRRLQDAEREDLGLTPLPSEIGHQEAVALLDPDTLGLVFASGVDRFHALVLAPQRGLEVVPLNAARGRLQTLTAEILEGLNPRAAGESRDRLEERVLELSRLLLTPLADRLGAFQRLAIVVEGPLDQLPFGILRHPVTGRHLIKSHEIAYLPSFSVLGALRQVTGVCSTPASELFAMGDPVFGSRDRRWPDIADPRNEDEVLRFRPLPGTLKEVVRIAEHYPDAMPLIGPEATRERFLAEAPAHRVIHIASHALSHSQVPERSRIVLSCIDAKGLVTETCDLYFADVLALELCGQTVVLSACGTAEGPSIEGEGILGLPWAFLRAGASTTVASLRQVADGAAAELMSAFHRHLRGGMDPAAALRQSKLAMIRNGQPPSAWAAFVLIGDWRAAYSPSTFPAQSGRIHRTD